MDEWLRELRSSPNEGALRGGERQARAAFRLARRDPTVRKLVLLEALAMTVLWALFYLLVWHDEPSGRQADRVLEGWLYWAVTLSLASTFSLAVAIAVDARIDAVEGDLGLPFGEVRQRLPVLLGWSLASLIGVAALAHAAAFVMGPLARLLMVSVVWGIGTFFVIPTIALLGGGPISSLGQALRFLRARWGRALAGLFVIGFLSGLAFIACGFLLTALARGHTRTTAETLWRVGGSLFLVYFVYAFASATRGGLAVILARDALGDLPGEPPVVAPRKRRARIAAIAKGVAVGTIVLVVGFTAIGVVAHHLRHRSDPASTAVEFTPGHTVTGTAPPPIEGLLYPTRNPRAWRLRPGSPVVLSGRIIGRVKETKAEPGRMIWVFYEVAPRLESFTLRARIQLAFRDGDAYLAVIHHREAAAPDASRSPRVQNP